MKYKDIAQDILNMIREGRFRDGDKIWTEEELASKYNVSRTTARHALTMLQKDGYLYRKKKAGTFVGVNSAGEKRRIAVLIPSEEFNNYEVLDSIINTNAKFGYMIDVFESKLNRIREAELLRNILECGKYCGLIFLPSETNVDLQLISMMQISGIQIVLIDTAITGFDLPLVTSYNQDGFSSLINHFISRGHRKIAFFGVREDMNYAERNRFKGYCKALVDNRIPVDNRYIFGTIYSNNELYKSDEAGQREIMELNAMTDLKKYKEMQDKPTALCFINDMSASCFLALAEDYKIDWPQDVVVSGFDNLKISEQMNFTTVQQDFKSIGREALEMLHELLTGRCKNRTRLVKTKLIIRKEHHRESRAAEEAPRDGE